jgi:ribosomal protein S18 acetylase RimI-like enzyme
LLGKAEQYASERGMYCMGLEVHTENINAMKFYHSQGYTQIRAQKSRAGQYPVFYYEKQLAL